MYQKTRRRIEEIEASKRKENNGQGDYVVSALQARNERIARMPLTKSLHRKWGAK